VKKKPDEVDKLVDDLSENGEQAIVFLKGLKKRIRRLIAKAGKKEKEAFEAGWHVIDKYDDVQDAWEDYERSKGI
jgi:cell division septum initiation protein DivIVA